MSKWWALFGIGVLLGAAGVGFGGDEKPRPAKALLYDAAQATVKRVPARSSDGDPRLRLLLTLPLGDRGWKLTTKSIGTPDTHGRIRVELKGERLPGDWPQAVAHFEHEIEFKRLHEGTYLLDIWLKASPHGLRRAGATVFRALGAP